MKIPVAIKVLRENTSPKANKEILDVSISQAENLEELQWTEMKFTRSVHLLSLLPGGICDGGRCQPIRVSSPGDLSHLYCAAGHSADAVRLPPRLRQREQGPHWFAVPTQLVCPDCQGTKTGNKVLHFCFHACTCVTACSDISGSIFCSFLSYLTCLFIFDVVPVCLFVDTCRVMDLCVGVCVCWCRG